MDKKLPNKILVIEDELHIAEGLRLNLALKGHDVRIAMDGPSGLQQWKEYRPDLIVLDIMLPGIDGLAILRNIRLDDEQIPILILSARAEIGDKIAGLIHGVDDYLAKPFNLEEFLLRVERLLLRGAWSRSNDRPRTLVPETYSFGGNQINFANATAVCHNGRTLRLTEQEAKLLKLFIANAGKPLSRQRLLEIGWSYTGLTNTRTVDMFVGRMRKYFEKNPKKPAYFKSLRSVGYMFEGNAEAASKI